MKIFIICHSLTHGGAERVGANLANGFAQEGHNVTLFTDLSRPITYPLEENIHLCPLGTGSNKILKWFRTIHAIRKRTERERPDVIIGMMHLCSFIGRIAAAFQPILSVLTIHHAIAPHLVRYSLTTRLADRWLPLLYPCVTVLTEADRCYYGNNRHIHVMPNPLTYFPVENIPPKEKIILAAGRLSDIYVKGWDLLIEAWSMVAADFPDWRLVLAGDGNEKSMHTIHQMIADRGVERQTFLIGYQSDLLPWFQRSAVYILSSRSEGLPMVLLEAMSQGCACLATDNNGRTADIITNMKEGLICQPHARSIAQTLFQLLNDDALRIRLQQGAIQRSHHYHPRLIIQLWERLIISQIKKRQS